MQRLYSREEAWSTLGEVRRDAGTVGFVPTMGALHEGHLSLVRASRERCGKTVVSIFVNPTQFGPNDDFDAYPRDMEGDLELLASEGVDFVYTPSAEAMYAEDASVSVNPGAIARRWEGEFRPGHFEGVATVVVKLLGAVAPDTAYFGEKDYQQLKVVESVVDALDIGTEIIGCATVRESDGLAMSSRNAYLSPGERETAVALFEALSSAQVASARGEREAAAVEEQMAAHLDRPGLDVEYAVLVDPETLEPAEMLEGRARALIAARIGTTRLIDNAEISAPAERPTPEEDE